MGRGIIAEVRVVRIERRGNQEMEDAALKIISLHLGLVADSKSVLAEWRKPGRILSA